MREDSEMTVRTIAFLIPNILPKEYTDPRDFITTIERIETLTGLTFLSAFDIPPAGLKTVSGELTEW
ncbi:hypothetical protein [Brucepastera parasyntrophica]|uniref:hypothetical protein n=1 Tax=Brucepastera parasyntrophica TaxID=2880008 RepID=UPI00210A15F6|nr:hypothetical protein [Brucepastera parasyntrophica]